MFRARMVFINVILSLQEMFSLFDSSVQLDPGPCVRHPDSVLVDSTLDQPVMDCTDSITARLKPVSNLGRSPVVAIVWGFGI
jgi:hypothetical protein